MPRWSTRLRRASALLMGVHLLQVILLAVSAVCEPRMVLPGHASAAGQTIEAHVASAHQLVGHHAAVPHAATGADTAAPGAPAHHAPDSGAPCPMAMACTVSAVLAPSPTFVTTEVLVENPRLAHLATAPRSTRLAPEPPPPRA